MEVLPPTARRILAAAKRLLVSDGFKALTLSAIASEADESKASIGYHFGNKDGLVAALVDSLTHDANRALIQECSSQPPGSARVRAFLEGEQRIVADVSSFQAFFEVLPYAMRDPSLRGRVAALYDGYRETVLAVPQRRRPGGRRRATAVVRSHDRHRRRTGDPVLPRPDGSRHAERFGAVRATREGVVRLSEG